MQVAQCADNLSVIEKVHGISKLYIAPEVRVNPSKSSGKADVYSLGVILYALIANDIQEATSNDKTIVLDFD